MEELCFYSGWEISSPCQGNKGICILGDNENWENCPHGKDKQQKFEKLVSSHYNYDKICVLKETIRQLHKAIERRNNRIRRLKGVKVRGRLFEEEIKSSGSAFINRFNELDSIQDAIEFLKKKSSLDFHNREQLDKLRNRTVGDAVRNITIATHE